jgi:hypothetical protein
MTFMAGSQYIGRGLNGSMPYAQRTAFAPDAVSVVEMFLLPDRCRLDGNL